MDKIDEKISELSITSHEYIYKSFIGKRVSITLSNNSVFIAKLLSIDGYMNIAVEDLNIKSLYSFNKEDEGKVSVSNENTKYKYACIRGACVERISSVID